MAKYRIPGKHYTRKSILGISLIVVFAVAIVSIALAAAILPGMVEGHEGADRATGGYRRPDVEAIVLDNEGQISVNADLTQVFVTVKYSDGSSEKVALSELVIEGLDTSVEGAVENVVLDFGGFKQTVTYNVVPTTLTVEYVPSTGGRIDGETLQHVTAGADATRVEAIPNEGYYFDGWSDGYSSASRMDTKISKSTKLIAVFRKMNYTVVFYYPDGTTAREEIVPYGQSPTRVPRPDEHNMQLYGYTFVGWDTDYTSITKDTNIYPIFEKNAADLFVEFTTDREGEPLGKIEDLMAYYPKGAEAVLRITANAGMDFVGWQVRNVSGEWMSIEIKNDEVSVDLAEDNYVTFRTSQTGTSEEYVLSFTPPEDNDLYANVNEIYIKADFVYEESEISFSSMSASVFSPINLPYGTPIGEEFDVEDLTKLVATGYEFKGWYDADNPYNPDGTPAIVDNSTVFTRPTELVAYWEKCVFLAVFLKGDNEDVSFTDPSAGYDEELGGRVLEVYYQDSLAGAISGTFPETSPVRENYTFKGWYLADEAMQPTDYVIDRNYKIDREIAYIIPVFEVNTRKLLVNIEGSGNVYYLAYNEQYDEYEEKAVAGEVLMPVTEDFVIRIRPGKDYGVTSVKLNGEERLGELADMGGYYEITLPAVLTTDYYLRVTYSLSQYEIAVVNGSSLASGSITYNVAGASESLKQTSSEVNFDFRVDDGVSVNLEISAPENYYIISVNVNGEQRAVPQGAVYYALVIDRIAADAVVTVVYNETTYTVTLPSSSSLEHGSMEAAASVTQYNGGESPVFYVSADEGYYIRALRANGTIVDPYFTSGDYVVTDILVNGEEAEEGAYDSRVTSLTLMVDGIYRDIVFELDIAPIYYYIDTAVSGVGNVTASSVVDYGATVNIVADTVTEYYVSAVTVNGEKMVYSDMNHSRVYTVTSVKKDYDVTFHFERSTHIVTFLSNTGADNNGATISYNGVSYSYGTQGRTFADISTGSSAEFTVTAPEGYYVNGVSLRSVADNATVTETVGFRATSHTFRIDNLSKDYEVTVTFTYINLDYTVYLLGAASGVAMKIDGFDVVCDSSADGKLLTYNGTVVFGSTLNLQFTLAGKTVSADGVKIVNREGTAYYYEAVTGAFTPSDSRGQYALVSSDTLSISDIDTEIDVFVRLDSPAGSGYSVSVSHVGEGTLTSTVTGPVNEGTEVTFTATPNPGYVLKAFMVNGKEVSLTDGKYTVTVTSDTSAYAIFEEKEFSVTVSGVTHGIVNTNVKSVTEGTSFDIRFIPATGYELTSFSLVIDGTVRHPAYTPGAGGVVDYSVPAEYVTGDVTVEASFTPIKYEVYVEYAGNGTVTGAYSGEILTIEYGTVFSLDLTSDAGHYIGAVSVNGLGIAASSLISAVIDPETNNFVSGILSTEITGDTDIVINFTPNAYTVTVAGSVGGVTYVKRVATDGTSTAYVDARSITFGAGDTLWVKMSAESGYHLSELRINGAVNNDWFDSSINVNDFSEVYFEAAVIEGNVTLRVTYAVNEYSITVNASNKSLNFAAYDTAPTSYGTVTLTGYIADANNVYGGINHGANVKVTIAPRTARGYYISLFEVVYGDGANTTLNLTSEINSDGGSYILQSVSSDIVALNVEFKRRTYTYEDRLTTESLGSSFLCSSGVTVTFTNPYSTSAEVITDNGKYEYGLSYTVNVNPGTGYERTLFTVNGEDRSAAVRANNYSAIISSDVLIETQYRILVYSVKYTANAGGTYYIRDELGNLVWRSGITVIDLNGTPPASGEYVYSEQSTASGMIWIDKLTGAITATYNTRFVFVATPSYGDAGFGISKFTVNSSGYDVYDGSIENTFTYTLISDASAVVTFSVYSYNITIEDFEGGKATASPENVSWGGSTSISLVGNALQTGYVITKVEFVRNGIAQESQEALTLLSAGRAYTVSNVRADVNVIITVERKGYDVIFSGDYNRTYGITDGNGNSFTLRAVAGAVINENVYGETKREFYSDTGGIDTSSGAVIGRPDPDGEYIGLRYSDKLSLRLTPPEGYYVTSVTITMDHDGYNTVTLVSGESGLDADDGSGVRTYTIDNVTGNVTVYVAYAIRQYKVTYETRSGGSYTDFTATTLSYYDALSVTMLSDSGYYLSSVTVNGQTAGVTSKKYGSRYGYSTDAADGTKLLVNAALVNNRNEITVTPVYERQFFNMVFYVNNVAAVQSGGVWYSADGNLGLELENNRVIYDANIAAEIRQTLTEGYSITGVWLCNAVGVNGDGKNNISLPVGTGANTYSAKGDRIQILLTEAILQYMDFEDANKSTLRIYYAVEQDEYDSTVANYLVTADDGGNKGSEITGNAYDSEFYISVSYGDNKPAGSTHVYGTSARFTANITAYGTNKYHFEGFQEYVNGEWVYVKDGVNGITLLSDGFVMEYTVQNSRQFRAVFFRLYRVAVEIHPEFKYYSGSFNAYNPSDMLYRLYSDMTAEAVYAASAANGVPLPNLQSNREILADSDTNSEDAVFVYYVRSGATLYLRGVDRYSNNATQGFTYKNVITDGGTQSTVNATYGTDGETILEDKTVYSYANNSLYVSLAMETIGSSTSSAGGSLSYVVNNATVTSLNANSLITSAGSNVQITMTPNSGYRFENVAYLYSLDAPDSNGYRQFTDRYEEFDTSSGNITLTYYDENGNVVYASDLLTFEGRFSKVVLTIKEITENTIIKVSFRKLIKLTSSISLITDESGSEPAYSLEFNRISGSSPDGVYDYNDEVQFYIAESIGSQGDWTRYYQFVGYFINGINSYTQLGQYYPGTTTGMFVLNDLDGLSDGVNIVERKTGSGASAVTEYVVNIVARFVPVYNVVVENVYEYENEYLDTGSVVATATTYNSSVPQYYMSSYNVGALTSADGHTDKSFSMLGKLNSIATSGITGASSPYNTWTDNRISLYWETSSPTYRFLSWQYYAFDGTSYSWQNIPYTDPSDPTNLVTRSSFSFPISCLFETTYAAYVKYDGTVDAGFYYNASTYDTAGNYVSSVDIPAIIIRPLYQKVETLNLVKSTAIEDENVFIDGEGAVEPKIETTSLSYGSFNYGTVQTLLPSVISGYEFAGWYIVDNGGAGGRQALDLTASDDGLSDETVDNVTYVGDYIQNADGSNTTETIYYNYNASTGTLMLRMLGSYVVYARYIRIYKVTLEISSLSGTAPGLTAALPYLKYYVEDDTAEGGWRLVEGDAYTNQRTINLTDARVGSRVKIMLNTGYTGDPDDLNHFNPRFDRYTSVTVLDDNNNDIFMTGGDYELSKDGLPATTLDHNDPAAYNSAMEAMYVIVSANRNKRVKINFSAYGELELHNVYWGSAIKLPEALAAKLGDNGTENGVGGRYISDGGEFDGDGETNGIIVIKNIPILPGANYDGITQGDFGNRLLTGYGPMASDYINFGINFNGSSDGFSKWQKIVYYGSKELTRYVWDAASTSFVAEIATLDNPQDYPFAEGDNEAAGNGTASEPFLISSVTHLRNIDAMYRGCNAELGEVYFKVIADINLNAGGNNTLLSPLCAAYVGTDDIERSGGFNGHFDGGGYTLSNLTFNMSGTSNVGLFAATASGAVIENVVISGVNISAGVNVGALVGEAVNTVISNVTVSGGSIGAGITGNNNVGGIAGYIRADRNNSTVLSDVSVTDLTVNATSGASYDEANGFIGGAGGIVGQIGLYAYVTSSVDNVSLVNPEAGTYTKEVTVVSSTGAGGIAGTIAGDSSADGVSDQAAISKAVAIDPVLSSYINGVAIGGVVGSVGQRRLVSDSYLALTRNGSIASASATSSGTSNFKEPTETNIYLLGAGGIAGHNTGTLSNVNVANVTGDNTITYTGSIIGGVVGVNFGQVNNATSSVRMYSSRTSGSSIYAGGSYGGIVGVNWNGYIINSVFSVGSVDNNYDSGSAALEVITNNNGTYTPTSGQNAPMHDQGVFADGTTVYIGGIAGYNRATINTATFGGKLMFNRRSSDATSNKSYIAAGVGYNASGAALENISASQWGVKFFHYVYVEQSGTDKQEVQNVYIGSAYGENAGALSNNSVAAPSFATAEYCGGGRNYTQASVEFGFTWTFYASGYLTGLANVTYVGVSGVKDEDVSSVVPSDINGSNIESLADDGAVYSSDCVKTGGSGDLLWKTAWNYVGYLRYIQITVNTK